MDTLLKNWASMKNAGEPTTMTYNDIEYNVVSQTDDDGRISLRSVARQVSDGKIEAYLINMPFAGNKNIDTARADELIAAGLACFTVNTDVELKK